jgi:pyruvate/2-oxoglutarate dehydrogenase complex dihydrolipoamide acyltransferase (E2) component
MYHRLPVRDSIYFDIHRRVTAHKTTESWEQIPHAALTLDLDVTALLTLKDRLRDDPRFAGARVTFNVIILKLIALALRESPRMTALLGYNRKAVLGKLTTPEDVNICMPFQLAHGEMITPVVTRADKRTLRELADEMAELRRRIANTDPRLLLLEAGQLDTYRQVRRGRFGFMRRLMAAYFGAGKLDIPSRREIRAYKAIAEKDRLTPADLTSGTVVVSNFGNSVRGMSLQATLLNVIRPQTTAIAVNPVRRAPVVVEDEHGERLEIRDICPLTVAIDHRAIDFAHVQGFIEAAHALSLEPEPLLA